MLGYIRKLRAYMRVKKEAEQHSQYKKAVSAQRLSASLDENLAAMKQRLGESADVVTKEFRIDGDKGLRGALLLIDGLVNQDIVNLSILKPMMYEAGQKIRMDNAGCPDLESVSREFLSIADVKKSATVEEALGEVLSGNTVLLLDKAAEARFPSAFASGRSAASASRRPRRWCTARARVLLRRCASTPPCCAAASKPPICAWKP